MEITGRKRLLLVSTLFFLMAGAVEASTGFDAPSTQASSLVVSFPTNAQSALLNWSRGNGSNCAVFVRQALDGNVAPADGQTYTANSAFQSGGQVGTSGWYCVYSGTGTSVTITGLTASKCYSVMVCEYNGSGASTVWNKRVLPTSQPNLAYTFSTQTIYRSTGSGSWTNTGIWEKSTNGGGSFSASGDYPNSDAVAVVIAAASHQITVDADVTAAIVYVSMSGSALTVNSGKSLLSRVLPSPWVALNMRGTGTIRDIVYSYPNSTLVIHDSITVTTLSMNETFSLIIDEGKKLHATIQIPSSKTLVLTTGGSGSQSGSISTVTVGSSGSVLAYRDVPIDTLTVNDGGIIEVQPNVSWNTGYVRAQGNLTLKTGQYGAATIGKVVMQSPKVITVPSHSEITVNEFDPGFTATENETMSFSCVGDLTIKAYTSNYHRPGTGDTISASSRGELHLIPGVDFTGGGNIKLRLYSGKLFLGDANHPVDVTLDGASDCIDINSSGVFTTWGGIEVRPQPNKDARYLRRPVYCRSGCEMVFLGSGKTLKANTNYDYMNNGTFTFKGGSYTLEGGFAFVMKYIKILESAELKSTSPKQSWEMSNNGNIYLDGTGTLNVSSAGDPIRIGYQLAKRDDQISSFTVNRANLSTTLALNNVLMDNAQYTSSGGQAANMEGIDVSGITFNEYCTNWVTVLPAPPSGGGGGGGQTDDAGDGETTDGETIVDVEGAESDIPFDVQTDSSTGDSVTTVGDPTSPELIVAVEGAGKGSKVNIAFGENDERQITVENKQGQPVARASVTGAEPGATVSVKISESSFTTLNVKQASGEAAGYVKAYHSALKEGERIGLAIGEHGEMGVYVNDENQEVTSGLIVEGEGAPASCGVVLEPVEGTVRQMSVVDTENINGRPVFIVTLTDLDAAIRPVVGVQLDADGRRMVGVADSEEGLLRLDIAGEEAGTIDRVDFASGVDGGDSVTLYEQNRSVDDLSSFLKIQVVDFPSEYSTSVNLGGNRDASVGVEGYDGDIFDVQMYVPNRQNQTVCTLTYHTSGSADSENADAAAVIPGFEGLGYGAAFGGSVDVNIEGVDEGSVITLQLAYEDEDVESSGVDEDDLRIYVLDEATAVFNPAGYVDMGDTEPTEIAGEYGIQTAENTVWTSVVKLGTFAIGAPVDSYPDDPFGPDMNSNVNDNDNENENDNVAPQAPTSTACGAGLCGAMGSLNLALLLVGMVMLKRRR